MPSGPSVGFGVGRRSAPRRKSLRRRYLERTIGSEPFCAFIKEHVRCNRFGTVTLPAWRAALKSYCVRVGLGAKLAPVDWECWTEGEGLPPVDPPFDRSLLDEADEHASRWLAALPAGPPAELAEPSVMATWPVLQHMVFLDAISERCEAELEKGVAGAQLHPLLAKLNKAFSPELSSSRNAELRFRFCMLAARMAAAEFFGAVVSLLEVTAESAITISAITT